MLSGCARRGGGGGGGEEEAAFCARSLCTEEREERLGEWGTQRSERFYLLFLLASPELDAKEGEEEAALRGQVQRRAP